MIALRLSKFINETTATTTTTTLWWTLTYDLYRWLWPSCEIFRSKIVYFESYSPDRQTDRQTNTYTMDRLLDLRWLFRDLRCLRRPTPQVEWSRADGKSWNNRIRRTERGHGTEIEIMNVEVEDEGIYRCTATNKPDGRVAFVDIRLLVQCSFISQISI